MANAALSRYEAWCDRAYNLTKRWIMPGLRNSQEEYRSTLSRVLNGHGRWLDLGCGHDLLPTWMTAEQRSLDLQHWRIAGVDLDGQALGQHRDLTWSIRADIETLPFRSRSFDLVTANMVLEHVREPTQLFREINRVLTDNGVFVVHTPNVHGYTSAAARLIPKRLIAPLAALLLKRDPADVYQTHYRANSERVLNELASASALQIDELKLVHSSPQLFRVPPLMVCEVLLTRCLELRALARFRACIVAILKKV